jgi:hypothetical protein
MTIEQIKQLAPGTSIKFTLPGHETQLRIKSNDGVILTCDVVGDPRREGHAMTWSLIGLEQINELSQ